jgi:hypothetical protein
MVSVLKGGNVEEPSRCQSRRELLVEMVPRYQKASVAQKGALLDEIVAATGYARRYAMWLLNHAEEMQQVPRRRRQRTYGPEVQHALFFVWQTANQICTKRLMPYLATHIEDLEREGHLHLTASCRRHLLSMSAATADRLLRGPRVHGQRGLATTRTGTLLKQQITIRTFAQWNETQPGFLEADVVAHCGSRTQGSYLYTLTLTVRLTHIVSRCIIHSHRQSNKVATSWPKLSHSFDEVGAGRSPSEKGSMNPRQ